MFKSTVSCELCQYDVLNVVITVDQLLLFRLIALSKRGGFLLNIYIHIYVQIRNLARAHIRNAVIMLNMFC